jgi:hypothetical protein
MMILVDETNKNHPTPPLIGIDGCMPVVMGMEAKKSYLEHRPVRLRVVSLFETFSGNQNVSIKPGFQNEVPVS